MSTIDKLNTLADYKAQYDILALQKQELIDKVYTPEIKQAIADIEAEFSGKLIGVAENIIALESEIKTDILSVGLSVKGEFLHAIYVNGRTSWDTSALDGYAVAHPEILVFRKVGTPSVSIRKV